MRNLVAILLLTASLAGQGLKPIPADDATRIREFYRVASAIQDSLWPDWGKTPDPLLLVTSDTEYLTHFPQVPKEFQKVGPDLYSRPRQFPPSLLATFPAFGPPSVIVIGEPANTLSKTSTPWLFTVMHEHFHQLQNAQPGYFNQVEQLGLSHGDSSGMWMLNYPFPYDDAKLGQSFAHLRELLLMTLAENDPKKAAELERSYRQARKQFFAQLSSDDHKYLSFQLWQEGIARYTQVKAAEAAEDLAPSPQFAALPDFTSFRVYGAAARAQTLDELKHVDLSRSRREVVYSFGAAEGFLLDRIRPGWKSEYFRYLLTTEPLFQQ